MDLNISFTKLFFFYRIIFLFALFFPFEDVNCFVLNANIFSSVCLFLIN